MLVVSVLLGLMVEDISECVNFWSLSLSLLPQVQKMKAIYHTLNLFNMDVTAKCLVGECWLPIADIDAIRFSLERGHVS